MCSLENRFRASALQGTLLERETSGTGNAWSQLDFCSSKPDPKLCSLQACGLSNMELCLENPAGRT